MNSSRMKPRRYFSAPFNNWRDSQSISYGLYYWPQINYDWDTGEIINVVFEKPSSGKPDKIIWPIADGKVFVTINIDFTTSFPSVMGKDGVAHPWDYNNWAEDYLGSSKSNKVTRIPSSYWDYRLMAKPHGNKACDVDAIEKSENGLFWGVEATRFNKPIYTESEAVDYFFREILNKRPAGFNEQQLKAQKQLMDEIGGKLFLIIHHESNQTMDPSADAYGCELDDDTILSISNRIQGGFNPPASIFTSFEKLYKKLMLNGAL